MHPKNLTTAERVKALDDFIAGVRTDIDADTRAQLQPIAKERRAELEVELRTLNADLARAQKKKDDLERLVVWAEQRPHKLQKNDHSRLHRLLDALREKRVYGAEGHDVKSQFLRHQPNVFVVRHDWAAAIGSATQDGQSEINLPFPECVFELMMNGRCVALWAWQAPGAIYHYIAFVECGDTWCCIEPVDVTPGSPVDWAGRQINAICIALDAEVATHEVMRAPLALNKKRERSGKSPLMDFHVVDLAKCHRTNSPGSGTHKSPRLHFRRGHWRHLDTHKAWIKWTLVGDPDLGFVDKQYRI